MSQDIEPLLNLKQVAAALGIGTRTMYRLIEQGKLRPVRVGRVFRFEPDEVRMFIAASRERREDWTAEDRAIEEFLRP